MVRKAANPKEITVKTDLDTYTLKVPTGALGWKHFRILMEVENERKNTIIETRPNPKTGEYEDYALPNPKLDSVMEMALDKWVETILPNILVSHEFEEIPWTDILSLFQAVSSNSSIDTTNFRDSE
jgi:hypothetical protein